MKDVLMTPEERQDHFETWHASIYVYLDELRAAVPAEVTLDYSLNSLKPLEAWLLDRYPDIDAARADMAGMINNAGAYIGETIRKTAGRGTWRLDDDEESIFHGFPILVDFRDGDSCSPITLASAATDRRRGDYLYSVASHLVSG